MLKLQTNLPDKVDFLSTKGFKPFRSALITMYPKTEWFVDLRVKASGIQIMKVLTYRIFRGYLYLHVYDGQTCKISEKGPENYQYTSHVNQYNTSGPPVKRLATMSPALVLVNL